MPKKNRTSFFLPYGETGKQVLKFQANFSEVFEVLSSNDGPNLRTVSTFVTVHTFCASLDTRVSYGLRLLIPQVTKAAFLHLLLTKHND